MTITELTPIEILNAHFAVPCDGPQSLPAEYHCGAKFAAEWVLFMVECHPQPGKQLLFCGHCKDSLLSWTQAQCNICGSLFRPASQSVKLIEPIGGTR